MPLDCGWFCEGATPGRRSTEKRRHFYETTSSYFGHSCWLRRRPFDGIRRSPSCCVRRVLAKKARQNIGPFCPNCVTVRANRQQTTQKQVHLCWGKLFPQRKRPCPSAPRCLPSAVSFYSLQPCPSRLPAAEQPARTRKDSASP